MIEKSGSYSSVGPIFIAAFDNEFGCDCGNEIMEGDEACYIDDELCCGDCGREAYEVQKARDEVKFTKKLRNT